MAKGKKRKGSLYNSIPAMAFFPLFLFGIVSLAFTMGRFAHIMSERVSRELAEIADSVMITYDMKYPGKYELTSFDMDDTKVYALLKGGKEITGDNTILDRYKESVGAEITIYYNEIRMITTLKDDEGRKSVGTAANQVVIKDVLNQKKAAYYPRVKINSHIYCCYYSPIISDQGACIGMVAVAKPIGEVNTMIAKTVGPYALLIVAAMILSLVISHRFANSLAVAIKNLNRALASVAKGDLSKEPDYSVMSRKDEIGEMGKNVVRMQKSLHVLIERDALTELYNRRLATRRLNNVIEDSFETGTNFCVCLGDIDFFKKVNDTYGHESGDKVLKAISMVFRKNMAGKGFAARWGGEEFLLVFDKFNQEQTVIYLGKILDEIRALDIISENKKDIIKVTMTFGIVPGIPGMDLDTLVRDADKLLYEGKTAGRNRMVYREEALAEPEQETDRTETDQIKDPADVASEEGQTETGNPAEIIYPEEIEINIGEIISRYEESIHIHDRINISDDDIIDIDKVINNEITDNDEDTDTEEAEEEAAFKGNKKRAEEAEPVEAVQPGSTEEELEVDETEAAMIIKEKDNKN